MTDSPPVRFAHDSEAELARVFDYYRIRWLYEPHTFPISWSPSGAVTEQFAPDFYLPDLDMYVELTTLKQGLVRKKNRKVRYLRQLYPDVRIKLFYARDFKALMLKYGRLAFLVEPGEAASSNGAARPETDGVGPMVADRTGGGVRPRDGERGVVWRDRPVGVAAE